jgi:hypothetical protein
MNKNQNTIETLCVVDVGGEFDEIDREKGLPWSQYPGQD